MSVNCSKFKDYKCKKCSAKHNLSVCSRQAIPVATLVEELQNTNTTANFNNKNILLQTAYAKLSSFSSNKTNDVRIILDTGSQKTYVTNDVQKYLSLQLCERSEFLSIRLGIMIQSQEPLMLFP